MTMTYAQNGNILSKTAMGSYTYGSSSRPHAVTEVDNTDGHITLQVQDVGFNDWNRMSSVWAYDENDFYSYSLNYGPDLRRVTSEMHRTYQELYFEKPIAIMKGAVTSLSDTEVMYCIYRYLGVNWRLCMELVNRSASYSGRLKQYILKKIPE